jgi:hypothetical protein
VRNVPSVPELPVKAVKWAFGALQGLTALSALADDGVSLGALPEEEAAEESVLGLTEHAAQRLSERGITPDQAKAAVQAAKAAGNVITKIGKYGTPQNIYTANGIRVVVEGAGANAGKIITAFK